MRCTWRNVAAAIGTALASLALVALAAAAGERATAVVELQVAPRGPGSVAVSPAGVDLDNGNSAVTAPCDRSDGGDSCRWGYERGTTVTLDARADSSRSFIGWSDPECPGAGPCTLTLDADTTSIVAIFSPLKLAVRYSGDGQGGIVTIDRAANTCVESGADACFELAPRSEVKLTARPAPGHTFRGWSPGCEPTSAPTCTIIVNDQPTWAGAHFDGDEPLQLPTSIKVQFRLKKTGDGGGQVTASSLACGEQCAAQFDYGEALTLTATPDSGSIFGGWNGVCAQTETTCRFPVGPITSVAAQFARAPFAARVVGVAVSYSGGRAVVVRLNVSRETTAALRLLRNGRTIVTAKPTLAAGTTSIRLRVPARSPSGAYRVTISVANPDGGTVTLPGRNVFIRRAR